MEHQVVVQQVIDFIREEFWSPKWGLSENTDLYKDLGLAGDDVEELFLAFADRFGFPAERMYLGGCFPDEGEGTFPLSLIFGKFKPENRCRVRHLVEAVETGEWPALEAVETE